MVIAEITGIATAILLAAAAAAAWRSARAAERNTQAQIVSSLLDQYASPEMLKAMQTLNYWKLGRGEKFAKEFARLRKPNYNEVEPVDHARRRVTHYFSKVYGLHSAKLFDKKLIRKVIAKNEIEFLCDVVEPLEKAINPDYDQSSFDFFAKLFAVERPNSN